MIKVGSRILVAYKATVLNIYEDGAVLALPDGMDEALLEYLPGEYTVIFDEEE